MIDSYEDYAFDKNQCIDLVDELGFISHIIDDKLLEDLIKKLIDLANQCIDKNNKRIQLYISGN